MDNATDTQAAEAPEGNMSDEQAVDWLLAPEESEEPEPETDEAPQDDETDPEESEEEPDAPDDEAENTDEDDSDDDTDDAESDEDEDDDPEPEDDEEQGQRYTVKVDGEERQVTLEELQRGYSGQAYIQKGMEEAKQFKNQLTQAAQSMQQERQALIEMYQQAQSTGFQPAPKPPSKELMQTDPIAYMEARAQYDDDVQSYQQEQQQIQQMQARQQQWTEQQSQRQLQEQAELLKQRIPELGDAKKAPEIKKRLTKAATEYGYSETELGSISDARAIQVLNDAAAYRELMAGKQAAKKPREQARAVTKPKGKARDGGKRAMAQKQMQKAMRTQSDDDWVNVLLQS